MVKNSINNNKKTNNHLSVQLIEHKQKTLTYGIGNPGPGLVQAQKVTGLKSYHSLVIAFFYFFIQIYRFFQS